MTRGEALTRTWLDLAKEDLERYGPQVAATRLAEGDAQMRSMIDDWIKLAHAELIEHGPEAAVRVLQIGLDSLTGNLNSPIMNEVPLGGWSKAIG